MIVTKTMESETVAKGVGGTVLFYYLASEG